MPSSSRKIHQKKKKRYGVFYCIHLIFKFLNNFIFLLTTLFVGSVLLVWSILIESQKVIYGSASVIFIAISYLIFTELKKDKKELKEDESALKSFDKGAVGEEDVEALLSELPADFFIINNFEIKNEKKGWNMDHIVVAPAGVFIIETKNTSGVYTAENGKMLRNNKHVLKDYLKQCVGQRARWRKLFKGFNRGYFVAVNSCLVLRGTKWVDKSFFELAKSKEINVCVGDYIFQFLLKNGKQAKLNPNQQEQVYNFIKLMNNT